ncbi:MAG: LCP family protein, partial [Candidatus Saccharimonadales bacterium]|nr:LCP family protein [Candidatus Saccharimonadales bacterium]
MTKKSDKRPQLDGIVRRPTRTPIGGFEKTSNINENRQKLDEIRKDTKDGGPKFKQMKAVNEQKPLVPIDLSGLDDEEAPKKTRRFLFWKRKAKTKKPWTVKRVILRTFMVSGIAVFSVGAFLGLKAFFAAQNIIVRDGEGAPALRANVDPSQLNGEGDGRVNIMLLGIGGDTHEAGDLADSILVVSIDPTNNEAAMLSIPRDLYVDVPGYYSTRINAAHAIGEDQNHPGGGIALMRETLEEILDIPIHYFVRVDFEGFIQAVDAVGGISINLDEPLYDTNFWWQYGILDLPAGENYLDGEKALYVARSRLTSPRGDFDRTERQRKILVAIKEKALSLGTFANPLKISNLISAAGDHVRTNIQVDEMLRLYEIAQEIDFNSVASVGLDNGPESYLASQNIGGASVLVPRSGDFIEIQEFVRE